MERILLLSGGRNFRDLGGYRTSDGRRVRWRRIFRSGVLAYLTDQGHEQLGALGIRTSCDFRDPQERSHEPMDWRGHPIRRLTWDDDAQSAGLQRRLGGAQLSAERAKSLMIDSYRMLPYRFIRQYTDMFRTLASGDVPLLISCAAGKDRTGLAAALLLASLGVSRDQIMDDYALTNGAIDLEKDLSERPAGSLGLGGDYELLVRASRQDRAPLMDADPVYLQAAFEEIERKDGSIDVYLQNNLGLDEAALDSIRRHLLES